MSILKYEKNLHEVKYQLFICLFTKLRFPNRLDNHADMHGHVDAGMRIAAGSPKAFAQVGIIVNPALQLAMGHLRIERGKVTLGQLGAAIGTDGKCFHRMNSDFVFTDVKILKIRQNTIHWSNYNQR